MTNDEKVTASRLPEFEHVTIRNYEDARKCLVQGSIIMDTEFHTPYHVEVLTHANGHTYYGYLEDGIGESIPLEGTPYRLSRYRPNDQVETSEFVTLYTPKESPNA